MVESEAALDLEEKGEMAALQPNVKARVAAQKKAMRAQVPDKSEDGQEALLGVDWTAHDGVNEVSVATTLDAALNPEERPFVSQNLSVVVARALNLCKAEWPDVLKSIFVKSCVIITQRNLCAIQTDAAPEGEVIISKFVPKVDVKWGNADKIKAVVAEAVRQTWAAPILSAMVACMQTFYSTNHHITMSNNMVNGYIGKVHRMYFKDIPANAFVSAFHIIGHALSFRSFLRHYGFDGVIQSSDVARPDWPSVGKEHTMRMKSAPAGLARLAVCVAIIRECRDMDVYALVPDSPEFAEADAFLSVVHENSARYAVWSRYVTGRPPLESPYPSARMHQVCSILAHTALKGRTISNAPCLMREDAVSSDQLFAAISGYMLAYAKSMRAMSETKVELKLYEHSLDRVDFSRVAIEASKKEENNVAAIAESIRAAVRAMLVTQKKEAETAEKRHDDVTSVTHSSTSSSSAPM
jgi:hypothetical protein